VAQAGPGLFAPHIGFNGRLPVELGLSGGASITNFADIDNDGAADLIMWRSQNFNGSNQTRMVVLINDGTGRFSISAPNVLPFPPFGEEGVLDHAVAADLNLDGYVDFILAVVPPYTAGNGRYFQVLINNRDGTFSDQTAMRLPGQSEALKNGLNPPFHFLADLDGDGDLDLLAKFFADDIAPGQVCCPPEMWKTEFYRNDGKGFFTPLPEGDYFNIHPNFLPLDVDRDGITDFVNPAAFNFFFTGQVWADFIKATGPPRTLFAATLPGSRSVQVGQAATFFATIINAGATEAVGCAIDKRSGIKGNLSFQATDPASNVPVGLPNTPVTIAAGGSQTFVVSVMPTANFTSTEFALHFGCTNTLTAKSRKGLNTVLLSASLTPIPDIVALAATSSNDGIVNVPGTNGTRAFAVATVNVGATGTITASADTGGLTLPVNISLCQTEPTTGQCISAVGPSATTQIDANATPTFGIFVSWWCKVTAGYGRNLMTLYRTIIVICSLLVLAPTSSWAQSIVAAVLPSSRSVQVGIPAKAFATIINAGSVTATSCGISLVTAIPFTFSFQTTNPNTNQLTGTPNTPVNIPAGAAQSFVVAFTPTQAFGPTAVQMIFGCTNTDPAPINTGLNTLLLSASATRFLILWPWRRLPPKTAL
jgi:hypothetical protein